MQLPCVPLGTGLSVQAHVDVPCNVGLSCCAAHAGADVLQLAQVPVGGDGQQHGERVGGDSQGVWEWLKVWEVPLFLPVS